MPTVQEKNPEVKEMIEKRSELKKAMEILNSLSQEERSYIAAVMKARTDAEYIMKLPSSVRRAWLEALLDKIPPEEIIETMPLPPETKSKMMQMLEKKRRGGILEKIPKKRDIPKEWSEWIEQKLPKKPTNIIKLPKKFEGKEGSKMLKLPGEIKVEEEEPKIILLSKKKGEKTEK